MRDGYYNMEHGATVDLIKSSDSSLVIITRIMVTAQQRGKGYARELMERVIEDADEEGVLLMLSVEADPGGLDEKTLKAWYTRLGFEILPGSDTTMVRRPVGNNTPFEVMPFYRT